MKKSTRRLYFVFFILFCLSAAAGLSLYALRDNLSYFLSPADLLAEQQSGGAIGKPGNVFRLGGLVAEGSVTDQDKDMNIAFTVTDFRHEVPVVYRGILPDLFREGQGVIARGSLDAGGVFQAEELLAKHDENYMPPEVARALKQEHQKK
jgi:cytochrome c-type biogenesis protein CcmE